MKTGYKFEVVQVPDDGDLEKVLSPVPNIVPVVPGVPQGQKPVLRSRPSLSRASIMAAIIVLSSEGQRYNTEQE